MKRKSDALETTKKYIADVGIPAMLSVGALFQDHSSEEAGLQPEKLLLSGQTMEENISPKNSQSIIRKMLEIIIWND